MSDINELMALAEANVKGIAGLKFTVTSLSEQMGVITDRVSNIEIELREKSAIDASQRESLDQAIKSRVAYLLHNDLGIDDGREFNKYFGKFTARCWNDMKSERTIIGKKGIDTPKGIYGPALDKISEWVPFKYGVRGYMNHLKNLEEREDK